MSQHRHRVYLDRAPKEPRAWRIPVMIFVFGAAVLGTTALFEPYPNASQRDRGEAGSAAEAVVDTATAAEE